MHQSTPLNLLTFPLAGSHLIEASAGTGKTFTIALLYVRLVLGHNTDDSLGEGHMPPDILVMTFTDAATQELRERIRSRLAEAAELFAEAPDNAADSGDPLRALRASIPPEQWPGCVRKLQRAVEWMDEAAVSTIHGWCHRMLNEHAFDSGSFFRQTLSTDQSELEQEVVRDYWRTFVYPLQGAAATAVLTLWNGPEALRHPLTNLLKYAHALEDTGATPAQRLTQHMDALAAIKARWQAQADELHEQVSEAMAAKVTDGRKFKPTHWQNWWQQCNDWAEDAQALTLPLSGSAQNRLTPEGIEEALKKPSDLPQHPGWQILEDARALEAALNDSRADILRHATHWVAERLGREKQQRAEMGFQDLITQLDEALQGPRGEQLSALIRRQFPVALVDEFQDTDPVQYRILDRVYGIERHDQAHAVILIGDPKQAIYAFRGADIFAYLQAREATAGRHWSLPRNFRSTQPMVDSVNALFSQADQRQARGAFVLGQFHERTLPYVTVAAQGRPERMLIDGQAPPALCFWHQPVPEDANALTKEAYRQGQSEACADEIVELLNLGHQRRAGFESDQGWAPVRARDIAVLVNSGTEAGFIQQALFERNVRSVYLSHRDSVLDTAEARDTLRWLQACAEPENLTLVRAALATPTLGLSHQHLDRLREDELALEQEVENFRDLRTLWQRQGVLPMLRRLLSLYALPARLLGQVNGERALTDVLHLAEILQQESQHLDGEHSLIRHFAAMQEQGSGDGDAQQVRLESEANLVQIVTVHKSKGLEYPLVFLPFATEARVTEAGNSFPLQWHDAQGHLQLSLTPTEEQAALADQERLGEDVRKLYVALTRARFATWVGAGDLKTWPRSGLGHLLGGDQAELGTALEQLAASTPTIVCEPLPEPRQQRYVGDDPEQLGEALSPRRHTRENWWIGSYSALSYGGDAEPDAPDSNLESVAREESDDSPSRSGSQATGPHRFPRGPEAGTFLHGILEWAAEQGFAPVCEDPHNLQEQLSRRCRLRGWSAWVPELQTWMQQILTTPFAVPGAHAPVVLKDVATYRPELEFWFESRQVHTRALDRLVQAHSLDHRPRPPLNPNSLNGMLKGFVDLVFEHEGRYYVLDYKSNALGPNDRSYTRANMELVILEKRYDLQFMLYLLALHRLLQARLPDYDYDRHVGGAVYLFLRGVQANSVGVYSDCPPKAAIEALDALFRHADQEEPA